MQIRIAALLVGRLGQASKISLKSVLDCFGKTCLAVDPTAKKSLIEFAESLSLEPRTIFCFHELPTSAIAELGIEQGGQYSEFGQNTFVKLTCFKWYLLKSVLDIHSDLDFVIFTDLDVAWLDSKLEPYLETTKQILIQDDTPKNGNKKHYCTGIMIWKNTRINTEILHNLFEFQFDLNKNGQLIPDEPILNNYFYEKNIIDLVYALPADKFIIGHRFFTKFHKVENFVAFHANYVIGDERKYFRLAAVLRKYNGNLIGYIYFVQELFVKIRDKVRKPLN